MYSAWIHVIVNNPCYTSNHRTEEGSRGGGGGVGVGGGGERFKLPLGPARKRSGEEPQRLTHFIKSERLLIGRSGPQEQMHTIHNTIL